MKTDSEILKADKAHIDRLLYENDQRRQQAEFERNMRIHTNDGGIYPPDTNIYLVENQGDNRAARRHAAKWEKKK